MTSNFNFLPTHGKSHQLLNAVWKISSQCWLGSVTGGVLSASRGWLRRFILLKVVMVLLLPHGAGIPLLLGCVLSLQALLLLRCPHISTKPSTVFLGQLALSDSLVLLQWVLRLGAMLSRWMEEAGCGVGTDLTRTGASVRWRETVSMLCHQLLDAHHLASLLLLGLLGLEATLVCRWPRQTRNLRTSHWAQLTCSLVWILVLLELMLSLHSQLQDSRPRPSLPVFSPCLRRVLWMVDLSLIYAVLSSKSQRRKSSLGCE